MTEVPDEPLPPSTLSDDAVRETLAYVRENPAAEDALPRLNDLREHLLRDDLADDVMAAAEAATAPVFGESNPTPLQQAHMIILLASLLLLERHRDRVDSIYLAWLRHSASYGPDRQTPPTFQRVEFVQRLGDLLGWGSLGVARDSHALGRFIDWVDSWSTRNKYRARRAVDQLRRNFPSPELWKRFHLN